MGQVREGECGCGVAFDLGGYVGRRNASSQRTGGKAAAVCGSADGSSPGLCRRVVQAHFGVITIWRVSGDVLFDEMGNGGAVWPMILGLGKDLANLTFLAACRIPVNPEETHLVICPTLRCIQLGGELKKSYDRGLGLSYSIWGGPGADDATFRGAADHHELWNGSDR